MSTEVYRQIFSRRIGAANTLSFRAVRILDSLDLLDRDSILAWLNKPSTWTTRSLGDKTYHEICAAVGIAVPANAPTTLSAKLRAVEAHIAKLEQEIALLKKVHP